MTGVLTYLGAIQLWEWGSRKPHTANGIARPQQRLKRC